MARTVCLILSMLLATVSATAQEKPKAILEADVVSHYMYRGKQMGNVCIQPSIGVEWKGFCLNADGSMGFSDDDYEELDLELSYRHKGFSVGLLDEWGEDWTESRYLEYGRNTNHQFSLHLGYECALGSLSVYTFFAGNDYRPSGRRAYSTFVQVDVPFRWLDLQWNLSVGFSPYESGGIKTLPQDMHDEYFEYAYGHTTSLNMVALRATKEVPIGKFTLPLFMEIHASPYDKEARLLMGVTLPRLER